MSLAIIPKRIQAIIDNLKDTHREILEVIESSRPEREMDAAQRKAVLLCRKLMQLSKYEDSMKDAHHRMIRLRTGDLELCCFGYSVSYMAVIKEGVMVAAFKHLMKTKQTQAYSFDYHFGPAFSTEDLRAFIKHPKPKSLVLPYQDAIPLLTERSLSMLELVGHVIYPDVFSKADINTSEVLRAYPHFKRKQLESDLGL